MRNRVLRSIVPRPEEHRESALLAQLLARLDAGKHNFAACQQISDDLDRQPFLLEFYMENFVFTGEWSGPQLDEIFQLFLLTWLYHEEYYHRFFEPLTAAIYNEQMEAQLRWAQAHVGDMEATVNFFNTTGPRVLLAYFFKLTVQPRPAMQTLPLDDRFNLQLVCMAMCACFQTQLTQFEKMKK